jgi:hypothetical protein
MCGWRWPARSLPGTETVRRAFATFALLLAMLVAPCVAGAAPITFGMHTPGDPFGGNVDRINSLESDLGRHIGVVSWFQNWGGQPWVTSVQPKVFQAVLGSRRLPLVTWEPWQPLGGIVQPAYSLRRIASGAFDGYITSWARALRALRAPVYLRPMHEMNGNWYPWGGTVNGNSPGMFRAAWRRMHRIFDQNGARNVRWVFSPINEDWPITPQNRMERYYPGRPYVDILALDGYNWGARHPDFGGWRSFRKTFKSGYRRITRLGPQQVWLAEVGSAAEGGDKAAWIRDMWRQAPKLRRLRALVWMDTVDPYEGDWRARSPAGTAAAFRAFG